MASDSSSLQRSSENFSRGVAKVYCGSIMRDFIVDRLALGESSEGICAEYVSLFGAVLSPGVVESVSSSEEEAIRAREGEYRLLFSSTSFVGELREMLEELKGAKRDALAQGDLRGYSQIASSLIRSLELFMKSVDAWGGRFSNKKSSVVNNYVVLVDLEKMGLLKIENAGKLRELFGFVESEDSRV